MSHLCPFRRDLEEFADAYRHVTKELVVRGNLVSDAHLAAILFQHGIRPLYSAGSDFKKCPSLNMKDPFAERCCSSTIAVRNRHVLFCGECSCGI